MEHRRQRQYVERFLARQNQRAEGEAAELLSDPDFRRVCRIVAEVAEEAMGVPVDSSRLAPSDSMGEDLGYSLDSLSWANLLMRLEQEFTVKVRWRDFQQATTIEEIFFSVFPGRKAKMDAPLRDCRQT